MLSDYCDRGVSVVQKELDTAHHVNDTLGSGLPPMESAFNKLESKQRARRSRKKSRGGSKSILEQVNTINTTLTADIIFQPCVRNLVCLNFIPFCAVFYRYVVHYKRFHLILYL